LAEGWDEEEKMTMMIAAAGIKARFGRERFINIHKLLGLLSAAVSRI